MTDQTTATAAATNTDASAQSTAAAAPATAQASADAAAVATQQKPADSTTSKPVDAPATPPAKEGDKPADKPEADTRTDAQKATDAKAATDKAAKDAADAEAAKAAEAPKAPEKYEAFTLPDGVKLSPEVEAKVTATAKEFNLPQEGAQKLVNAAVDLQKSFSAQMDTKITAIRAEWETNSRADKEFGGDNFDVNLAIANTAVRAFGSPAFKQLLKDSGVGSHPEFIRTFLNIGKSISQDTIVGGGDGVASASASGFTAAASKLYGGNKS